MLSAAVGCSKFEALNIEGNRHFTASLELFPYVEALKQKLTVYRAEHGNRGAANIRRWGNHRASVLCKVATRNFKGPKKDALTLMLRSRVQR